MALNKLTYVDNVTVIPASNLNEIQDAIIDLEENSGNSVPTNVRQAIYTLLNSGAYATTGLTDEIAIVESWAEQVTALSISPTTLSLSNNTPQTITATVVPSGSTVSWSSSDTSVATVVGGVVTGVSNGTCVITASAGTKSATCSVTVSGFATLVSISAVYTQSGTVYDTDSLDSLKADLVVTATYDDTSTETITNYVLSGTLAVGTSTITVSYGGKTTTFTVTVTESPLVPTGYTQYDYITNTASMADNINNVITTGISSSYCDTQYIHEIELYIPSSSSGGTMGLYGSRKTSGSAGSANGNSIWLNSAISNKIAVGYNGVDSGFSLDCAFGAKHTIKMDTGNVYIDDTIVSSPSGERTSYSDTYIGLFGVRQGASTVGGSVKSAGFRFYSLKITDSTTNAVVANLIPCTNPDNIAGVYDTVSGTFHYATNYTNFNCGNEE